MSIEHPTGKLHPFERRHDEPWHLRWLRMTGILPGMKEKKRATTRTGKNGTGISVAQSNKRKKHVCTAVKQAARNYPRVQMPDFDEHFGGVEI